MARPTARAAALVLILALAAALRIVASPPVYTADGVRYGPDSDPYYHVLRARDLAVRGEIAWHDPAMNYPAGAEVLWPPGFDALIAGTAWVTALGRPTDAWVERVAPAVPVALGVASVFLVALLGGELLGGGLALGSALLLCLIQPHLQYTCIQRPDQHAAELALFPALMLLFARAIRPGGRTAMLLASAGAGVVLALAFWTWQGSAVVLLVLGGFAALWHVAAAPGDPSRARVAEALAATGAAAALVLGASIATLGAPGALSRGTLNGITGLSPALCLAAGAFGGGLAVASRWPASRARRALEAALASAAPLAILAALPSTRDGILHGLAALAASNPWYERIREYQPLLGSRFDSLSIEVPALLLKFGLTPVAVAAGVPAVLRLGRGEPERTARVAWLLSAGGMLLALTLARHRFEPYLAIPMALLAPAGIRSLAARLAPTRRDLAVAGGWLVAVAPMAAAVPTLTTADPVREAVIQVSKQLGEVHTGEPRAVLAGWDRGHEVRYFSGLPVIATPFGTDLGPHALDDSARFWLAETEQEAQEVLAARRARWLLLEQPEPEIALAQDLLGRPGYVRELRGTAEGGELELTEQGQALVSVRLYHLDGVRFRGAPSLTGFRLVQEVVAPGLPSLKVFEVVRGAVLRVPNAAPGAEVEATTEIVTPDGRRFPYAASATADASGRATLRVPYATGANGAVGGGPYAVRSGDRSIGAQVPEVAVREGWEAIVRLP